MNLLENLRYSFLGTKRELLEPSSEITPNAEIDLSNSELTVSGYGMIDDTGAGTLGSVFGDESESEVLLRTQSELIQQYRRISKLPEISNAINEIVNEALFDPASSDIYSLEFDEGVSESIQSMIISEMNKIDNLLNIDENLEILFRRFYIDGKLPIGVVYNNQNIKQGIQSLRLLSPIGISFNKEDGKWGYTDLENNTDVFSLSNIDEEKYSIEELILVDSGLYENGVSLSYLHNSMKTANQLASLEDMMIPFRHSRSVSRRVFNIDVGNLPFSKAMQAISKIKNKFKYKKSYDVNNGTIKATGGNNIVEDYFLPKRGGVGSDIDVLDEKGNLGETGDLEYFKDKLNQTLNVPMNRLNTGEEGGVIDFTGTQVEFEEKRFQKFLHKLKLRFGRVLIELLRRQLISKEKMNEYEFDHYKNKITIRWQTDSSFAERERLEDFNGKFESYNNNADLIGELYSKKYYLKNVLRFTDEEIIEMEQSLITEKEDTLDDQITQSKEIPDDFFEDIPEDEFMDTEDDEINPDNETDKEESSGSPE